MFQRTKRKGAIGAYLTLLLCCALIISSVLVAPSTAEAAGKKEQIDKLIQDWQNRYGGSSYWKLNEPSEEEIQRAIKSNVEYHALPQRGHISQNKALRYAVEAVLRKYDLTPSGLTPYWPQFSFIVDKNGKPYWQIMFRVDPQAHKMLKTITVQIDAISGNVRAIRQGNDG